MRQRFASLKYQCLILHWKPKTTDALEELIAKAQTITMTEHQAREQRLSFVYGNTHIENERITRKMVAQADERVSKEQDAAAGAEDRSP